MNDSPEEDFDFEATRQQFPDHWNESGCFPARESTWRARAYLHLRVCVLNANKDDVEAMVYWDGSPDELKLLFAYETDERWNIQANGLVYAPSGIDRDRRWRSNNDVLTVTFERPMFGGPDTWHAGMHGGLPFFEPIAFEID